MCAACSADLLELGEQMAGVVAVEAEACAQRLELRWRIERILDGDQHADSAPVLEP